MGVSFSGDSESLPSLRGRATDDRPAERCSRSGLVRHAHAAAFQPGFATLGRILGQMGRIEEAEAAYGQSLHIDPQGLSALVGLARLHLARGDRDAARRALIEAVQYHPQDETIANILVALDLPRPWSRVAQETALQPGPAVPAAASAEAEIRVASQSDCNPRGDLCQAGPA